MEDPSSLLSTEDCQTILTNYLRSNNFTVQSYTITPFSETVEGFLGQTFSLKINFDHNSTPQTSQFFMKSLNSASSVIFQLTMELNAYIKEETLYKHLFPEYERLSIDVTFAPNFYFCKPFLIVLDDLSMEKFKMVPKQDMFDLYHVKKALACLAKFHASSLIYEELKSVELGTKFRLNEAYKEALEQTIFTEKENKLLEWFKCSVEGMKLIIDMLGESGEDNEWFKMKLVQHFNEIADKLNHSKTHRNVILHRDLWTNNFLFTYENNLPNEVKLLDYQTVSYGLPSIDVVQLIVTDTRKALRDEYYGELLQFYYDELSRCLKSHSLNIADIIPKKPFLDSCSEVLVYVKILSISDRSITFLSDECCGDAFESDENLRAFLFEDRSKIIKESFEKSEEFRELITEDLMELRDLCKEINK